MHHLPVCAALNVQADIHAHVKITTAYLSAANSFTTFLTFLLANFQLSASGAALWTSFLVPTRVPSCRWMWVFLGRDIRESNRCADGLRDSDY